MGTAYITFGEGPVTGTDGVGQMRGRPLVSETVTTSGTSAQTDKGAPRQGVASVYCDADAWVTVGADPTASATAGWFVAAGTACDIGVQDRDKVAIIEA